MAEIAKIKGYDIRDKKLADATSKTAVASTDSIRMKDTNGNEVFIARDSFVEAVRSVLGGLVTSLDKGTGASGVACVDSNNDLGTITPANLASVLSASFPVFRALGSGTYYQLSGIDNGVYTVNAAVWVGGLPSNFSDHSTLFLRVPFSTNNMSTIALDIEGGEGCYMQRTDGGTWTKLF